jgi:16S rRNA (guanine527-N7)-methyltransferase
MQYWPNTGQLLPLFTRLVHAILYCREAFWVSSSIELQCCVTMNADRIRELLEPFTHGHELSDQKLSMISAYLDLLLKWNARINLTAIRDPEQIVQRHFGESLFAAQEIADRLRSSQVVSRRSLIDVGSGAGFPGIPIKMWLPELHVTLVEARQKKATFLREVARSLALDGLEVLSERAADLKIQADVVTLRAVEQFENALPAAARLVRPGGSVSLLIGSAQVTAATSLLPFSWDQPSPIPLSISRVLLLGRAPG